MLLYYFDASALAKGYIKEKGTPIVERILEKTSPEQWRVLMLGLLDTIMIWHLFASLSIDYPYEPTKPRYVYPERSS